MPSRHLRLSGFEVIGDIGLDFSAHSLASPLFETIKFPVDVHFWAVVGSGQYSNDEEGKML